MEVDLENSIAIIIDVFRASNTIIQALSNGAKKIMPVTEIDLAWQLKEKFPEFLLGGERNSIKIEGFELGNSPLEYTKSKVLNKSIVLATSNGSKALKKAEKAKHIFVASFANISAIVKKIDNLESDIAIVCSGTLGTPSLEDTLAAGKIIDNLKTKERFTLNDYAYLALGSYQTYQGKIYETILKSRNGLRLQNLNKMDDIEHCTLEDITDIVPEYNQKSGYIFL